MKTNEEIAREGAALYIKEHQYDIHLMKDSPDWHPSMYAKRHDGLTAIILQCLTQAQEGREGEAAKIKCPHCQSTILWSEDRGAHCDGCDDFDPEADLPEARPIPSPGTEGDSHVPEGAKWPAWMWHTKMVVMSWGTWKHLTEIERAAYRYAKAYDPALPRTSEGR
jgi:endogenous inhibitor of DNA gyrase (YacG/DUF329 family)